jgi:hypothetical protein
MRHELKVTPQVYSEIRGWKHYQILPDRPEYQDWDFMTVKEYNFEKESYTGRECLVQITHLTRGEKNGLQPGFCVMNLELQ